MVELRIADHQAIYCDVSTINQNGVHATCHLISEFRSFKKLDIAALQHDLKTFVETFFINATNISKCVSDFCEHFCKIWNHHAPLIHRRVHQKRTPWIRNDILASIHERNASYKKFLSDKTSENKNLAHKVICNEVHRKIRLAK